MPESRPALRHRLWWRIWLVVLLSIVLVALAAATLWRLFLDPTRSEASAQTLAAAIVQRLPPPQAPAAEQRAALERLHQRFAADLGLFDEFGGRVAWVGRPVPAPRLDQADSHWILRGPHGGVGEERARWAAFALRLPDARWLVVRRDWQPRPPFGLVGTLALIALAVGLGTYWVARRLTRRLERLQASVQRLGAGDLGARVDVAGRDEVALLAANFNEAAARIETLVQSQRALLANASHELRSPLARVRLAVEMLKENARPELRQELTRDIAELDQLIDEILLASRLDAGPALLRQPVDLAALAAEECARSGALLDAPQAVTIEADARLLRRLLRNLLDNARRYDKNIEVQIGVDAGRVHLEVRDRGPGVPAAERERIFEPFYRLPGASESGGSVGLGLALVRRIAQQHRGTVACLPRDGGGSVFRVELPMATASSG